MHGKRRGEAIPFYLALILILLVGADTGSAEEIYPNGCDSGQRGWDHLQWDPPVSPPDNTFQQLLESRGAYDGISLQWDYFMVHDDDFAGSFGFVVANPRNDWLTSNLMPTGGSAAISGKFLSGSNAGTMFADYYRFSPNVVADCETSGDDHCYNASAADRSFYGRATHEGDPDYYYGKIELEGDGLRLSGATDNFRWNLLMTQDWTDRCPAYLAAFPSVTGFDAGGVVPFPLNKLIQNEFWTVDMNWMRMHVTGTIQDRNTGELFDIDGHGYREATWGSWAFNYSGWDFIIASDEASQIQWSLQTYHHSDVLDYLDVSFYDGPDLKTERFENVAGELGFYHTDWKYDTVARQCIPEDLIVIAKNDDYIVESVTSIDDTTEDNQIPMLSDLTPFTDAFSIVIRVATVDVTVRRASTGEIVGQFQDKVGGGEFGIARRPEGSAPLSEDACHAWGGFYTAPLPASMGCVDEDEDGYGLTGAPDCTSAGLDCDDRVASIYPGAVEDPVNGVDDDCDGIVDEPCFIATAAFGSETDQRIHVLRTFRDRILKQNRMGRAFLKAYYEVSPALADTIRQSPWLRGLVRILLLPVIGLVSLLV